MQPRRVPLSDRILLTIFLPLWAVCFALGVATMIRGDHISHVAVRAAESAGAYPTVAGFRPYARTETDLRVGDRLLQLGEKDLRGMGAFGFQAEVLAGTPGGQPPRVRFERGGEVGEDVLPVGPYAFVLWPWLPISLSFALVAVVLLLRARPSPMIRWAWLALACVALHSASHFGGSRALVLLSSSLGTATSCLGAPLLLLALQRFPEGEEPRSAWARYAPWLFVPVGLVFGSTLYGLPFTLRPERGYPLLFGSLALFVAIALGILMRNYRRADPVGRRQLKWFILGSYVAGLPIAVGMLLPLIDARFIPLAIASVSAAAIMPLALLVSVVRYNLFDVDRLLSATATYNLVIVLLVGVGLALVPRIAEVASAAMGIGASTGQLVLSLALAAVVVPAERRLRPQVERFFFRERHATDEGIAGLLVELSDARDPAV